MMDGDRPESFRPSGNVESLRVPPQSVEAEQAVIGGLMLAPDSFDQLADLLAEVDFYRRDHRLIFRGIVELHGKHKPFDAVTLGEWFEANGLAEQIGGAGYLITLASTTPSAANIRAYAEIVASKSKLRQLIELGTQIVNDGFQPEGRDPTEIVSAFTTKLGQLMAQEPCELEGIASVVDAMFASLQGRYERGGEIDGMSTSFDELDRVINGLKGGLLYLIAARPKMGKSTLANNIAEHVALDLGKRVAYVSLEMPREQVVGRMACSQSSVRHTRFRTGQLEDGDWSDFNHAIKRLKAAPLYLSRPHNTRAVSLCAQIRRLHAKKPLSLVLIDYLQLIETDSRENRAQGLGDVSRQLKMLAIDLNVPVIALSQLSRKVEERPNKRPVPSDLRDSGALEQDCDVLIFLYRDEVYHKKSCERGTVEVDVALQREGPSEMVRLLSRLDICRFKNLPDDWMPEPTEKKEQGEKTARKARKGLGSDGAARAAGPDA
jgi:replicative DNA helicase